MKTKFFVMILMMAMLITLTACGNKATAKPVESMDFPKAIEPNGVSSIVEPASSDKELVENGSTELVSKPSDVVIESNDENMTEPVEEPEDDDPYRMLEVTEEFARSVGGVYVKKGDKLYSASYLPREYIEKYKIGMEGSYNSHKIANPYILCKGGCVMAGEFPIMTVDKDDVLVSFGITDITLREVESSGYSTFCVTSFDHNDSYSFYDDGKMSLCVKRPKNFEIRDENGNVMDGLYNLEYGKYYVISWFEGTDYHERREIAKYCAFSYGNMSWMLTGELTRESYAKYDLSTLTPGFYGVGIYGVIEIV